MAFHPDTEKLVQILCDKTQNTNPLFFRVMVAYYFSIVATMMRCNIATLDRGNIPVNCYAINLMTSGAGKTKSVNCIEDTVINQFRFNFTEHTFPLLAQQQIPKIALRRAAKKQTDPDEELVRVEKEFESFGNLLFSFDSGTTPAVKGLRQKMLMAEAGSLNFQMDELGSHITTNMEILNAFLELYDVGKIKQKLIKNTADNLRSEEIHGSSPTNMLLFGTPANLLNGSKTEEEFYQLLETGYARRCLFGYTRKHERNMELTPQEVFARNTDKGAHQFLQDLSDKFGDLADMIHMNKQLQISEAVTLLLIEYQLNNERKAFAMPEHEEMRKAEISHRHFKALKLAGAYTFVDGAAEVTEDHLYYAIKLVEESGEAFNKILTRDRPYVKLAKYLADIRRPVTQVDLVEDLPFYKGGVQQKQEMLQLSIAYGYQNNILIKKLFTDGIEFLVGETLERTDLSKMTVSYSRDIAKSYQPDTAAFEDLHKMTQANGMHWCSHTFRDGHRTEECAIPGFNLVVVDVDGGINLDTALSLLKDYKLLAYTTKRHTAAEQRFRIVLPTNYTLKLDAKDYKEFMASVFQWLPFEVDTATGQRARKWMSNTAQYIYQDGEMLDVLPFIPKTTKNEQFKSQVLDQQGMDNLERWVINNTGDGNRNNMLLRFAMILVDAGFLFDGVLQRVTALNSKLPNKLDDAEIMSTIMVSVGKSLGKK